ncbi:MAG: hypothetical protein SO108_01025 [Bacilli bacterium]|nr:hypothetical protein [Bacilli bacterium]
MEIVNTLLFYYLLVLSYYRLTKNDKKAFFIIEGNYLSSFLYDDIIASNQALIFKRWKNFSFSR